MTFKDCHSTMDVVLSTNISPGLTFLCCNTDVKPDFYLGWLLAFEYDDHVIIARTRHLKDCHNTRHIVLSTTVRFTEVTAVTVKT